MFFNLRRIKKNKYKLYLWMLNKKNFSSVSLDFLYRKILDFKRLKLKSLKMANNIPNYKVYIKTKTITVEVKSLKTLRYA